jgi:hypothetical protein
VVGSGERGGALGADRTGRDVAALGALRRLTHVISLHIGKGLSARGIHKTYRHSY